MTLPIVRYCSYELKEPVKYACSVLKRVGRSVFRNGALFEKEEGSIAEIES